MQAGTDSENLNVMDFFCGAGGSSPAEAVRGVSLGAFR
jgi:hypothetical protein